jgi:hypothetical protein
MLTHVQEILIRLEIRKAKVRYSYILSVANVVPVLCSIRSHRSLANMVMRYGELFLCIVK